MNRPPKHPRPGSSIGTFPSTAGPVRSLLESIPALEAQPSRTASEEVQQMMKQGGSFEVDILIIGAGPGGYVSAIRAAQLGAKTACVEKGALGGVCLNVGCIPTKTLISTAELVHNISRANTFGIKVGSPEIDVAKMMERKDKVVSQLTGGVATLFKNHNVEWVKGAAKLTDPHTVAVDLNEGGSRTITARNIIVATGSVPALLPLPGFEIGEAVWTSNEALDLKALPKSVLIVGGGAIGLEFGYTFVRLGSQVTIVELMSQIVPAADMQIAKEFEKCLKRAGIKIMTETGVTRAEDISGGKRVFMSTPGGEQSIEVEKVLVAVGRRPVSEGIGLEQLGIKTERGRILVNERMQTNVPNVYAVGDVVGEPMLAHVAWTEGEVAVQHALGRDVRMSYRVFPACVYTVPELASVGMTEEQAREKHSEIRIGTFPFAANGKALGMGEREGFVKIIAEPKYGEILGVHILGPHATDLISEAVVAMQNEATVEEVIAAIHPHPTLSEPIQEAAMDVLGESIHKG
ncbi:MAG: dihydrolipoyl dehydrogenase [Armatimonadota bacterium]|nr:dihydrolipoyl dehydrogenase [Armatimonadota bacterium]